MNSLDIKAKESFEKQCDPEQSNYECFFHYTDEKLYSAGFRDGYLLAQKEFIEQIKISEIKECSPGREYLSHDNTRLLCVKSEPAYQCCGCYYEGSDGYPSRNCEKKCPSDHRFIVKE